MTHLTFKNNDKMPAIGLGTWLSAPGVVGAAVKSAIKSGYRHIDCALIYGNEKEIGQALTEVFAEGEIKREDLWITSKLWNTSHGQDNVRSAIEKTLSDLQLDYLDLYLVHWPVVIKPGSPFPLKPEHFVSLDEMPLSDTWKGMEAVHAAGLARHIGVSNFSVKKLKEVMASATHPPEMNQVESHPYLQQNELVDFCRENGIHFTAYSPIGRGGTSNEEKTEKDPVLMDDPTLVGIAEKHGCTPVQVLLAWGVQRGTSVIPKSTNAGRIEQNIGAQNVTLTNDDMEAIQKMDRHYRFIDGTFWTPEGGPYTLENLWDEDN